MGMFSLVLLAIGSTAVVAVSWRSLRRPRCHGFHRFFAFEAIVCIVALNAPLWFIDPLAARQLASWLLLILAAWLAASGFWLLHRAGTSRTVEPGSPLFRIERTQALVTTGPYRLIRHPLYASVACLACGAALKDLTPVTAGLGVLALVCLAATAKVEEQENVARFGDAYRSYMARTRLFIPFLL